MGKHGLIAFKVGSALMLVSACLHLLNHFSDPSDLFEGERGALLWNLYNTYAVDFGFVRTLADINRGLSWVLFLFLAFSGVQNSYIAHRCGSDLELMSTLAILNVVLTTALIAVTAVYLIVPTLVLLCLIWLMFGIAFLGRNPQAGAQDADIDR